MRSSSVETIDMERELVAKAKKGDQTAFAALVDRYGARLYGAVLTLVRNPQDAEDIVQEAFLKALRNLGRFRQEASFGTWLHRIAYNLAYDQARKKREVVVAEFPEVESPESTTTLGTLDRAELAQALRALSPEMQVVILLRHGEDLSIHEIAHTLKIPEGTVKSRLYNGYRRLRIELTWLREEMQ